ncbi:2-hydroxyglutaryl-CoA dehydratase [Helicobacter monodelphidis]|uniref:acyl-CoA dehydratase activase n=1 Tax=Helicobacter sp. 15-1451 TaxID=2004995 RepID=UPI000DCCC141|nr:acyl-CoA dehydratase activase [Helicobacter sp. 15-1451]RAX58671.1 2-hydroxyglutaryl-CoA dehydratase [Helicobacter sp. 15-1451]
MGLTLGIDIGSTTAKVALLDGDEIIYKRYERHYSKVREKSIEIVEGLKNIIQDREFKVSLSGSAGFGICKVAGIDFVQEVFATAEAVKFLEPSTDVVIELGGEDAKILFLSGGTEERMNGSCAGGTGAFIDQMVTLLAISAEEFDAISLKHKKIYPVASRCGVFAKTDVQPLLNQGVNKEDITASIFQAVVDQTITGLAQGREIGGKVMFLGGPLFFYKGLQERFTQTLKLDKTSAIFPDYAQYSVAIGVSLCARESEKTFTCDSLITKLIESKNAASRNKYLEPLFKDEQEFSAFTKRHQNASVDEIDIDVAFIQNQYKKLDAYIGIDCGSTTTKLIILDSNNHILYQYYNSNQGNPTSVIQDQLNYIYRHLGDKINIRGSAVTGYGEELIKAGFGLDAGIVETMAHLKAAQYFNPRVDFIIDIGGQDIKCFFIRNNSIDSILLNEACSSGCGSFIETFAKSMGYNVSEFSKLGLKSKHPVELGSRCTVFMNSSVKEAQKEGACIEDISAGLSISVVKNAIYKVIRARDADDLGQQIVVQGGTFLNDAVLRSFEKEINRDVIRPKISGLMGAFGAALHAKSLNLFESNIIQEEALQQFSHKAKATVCKICGNNCNLTINRFSDDSGNKRKFISGNRCDKPLGLKTLTFLPNLYEYKLNKLKSLTEYAEYDPPKNIKGKVGIPLALNMYENLPFWHKLLSELGYEVVVSDITTRDTFTKGQYSIPSDTVCYPAKLVHGHIENLLEKGVDTLFYPCMSYNFESTDQHQDNSTNNYNCPVVAYYPELLNANVDKLKNVRFLYPYMGLHKKDDFYKKSVKFFTQELNPLHKQNLISKSLDFFTKGLKASEKEFREALQKAYEFRHQWLDDIKAYGEKVLDIIHQKNLKAIVLCGRPYHIDPEINHGIDKLINSLGLVVLSEDSIAHLTEAKDLQILNQWSYHSRLYNAAEFVCNYPNIELVQLVSFGCGIDSITTDEVRSILESKGRFYTQLKIDEISNLGAVKIRIRSLLAAMEEKMVEKRRLETPKRFENSLIFKNVNLQRLADIASTIS